MKPINEAIADLRKAMDALIASLSQLPMPIHVEAEKKPEPLRIPSSPEARRIAALFNRKLTTPWSVKEIRRFRELGKISGDDLTAIECYYAAERKFGRDGVYRRDLYTFLNNFWGELDRARAFTAKASAMKNRETPMEKMMREDAALLAAGHDPAQWRKDNPGKSFAE